MKLRFLRPTHILFLTLIPLLDQRSKDQVTTIGHHVSSLQHVSYSLYLVLVEVLVVSLSRG